jgi:hypothetical protein
MSEIEEDDWNETSFEDWERQEEEHALSPAGIVEQNDGLLRRYRDFRRAADAVAAAWRDRPDVAAVALIGSAAAAPWKEVPRFAPYHRAGIALWHDCKDVDLAVWCAHLRDLNGLRRTKDRALRELQEKNGAGVASHQADVFILELGTDRYLGRLCPFNRCPRGKAECRAPGCGESNFLQQHEGFRWRPESLAGNRSLLLFDRATDRFGYAADLPLPAGSGAPGGRSVR